MSNDNPQRPPATSADFPLAVRHVQVHGARMAYVDEGSGDPIVFLHGNPTSSYLWRNVIPHVRSVGRCIAPDLIGMGRSDKPDIGYRFVDHARYIDGFLEALGLDRITFVVHDWGSALGFDWAMRHESRVRGLAFMEAILGPVPSWEQFPPQDREIFQKLRTPGVGETMVLDHNMFVEQLLPGLVVRSLSPAEMQHYRAPFVERAARRPMVRKGLDAAEAAFQVGYESPSQFGREYRRMFEQDLFGSDPAVLHLDDSIGRVGNARIVGHHQNRAALVARQLDKQFDDFAARFAVQR